MKRIYHLALLLMMSLLFVQCQKELAYDGESDPLPEVPVINKVTPAPITANLQGNILDENGQPAAGVAITVGTKTAQTDANGYFRIVNAPLDKYSALVVAEKSGYFKGMRLFAATSGTNNVEIKLVKKTLAGNIASATGGDVTLSNGSKVALPANGVVVASTGAAYTGNVNIYAAYIDPTANDIARNVPGSFQAVDSNGSRVALDSYGMLAVELQSDAGEKLQIKSGSAATLTTAIPAARTTNAPATIRMWSVDEQTGLWVQEGIATKQGNNYVGDVKHFSFWNCDQPLNGVYLSMTLKDTAGLPLTYALVKLTRSGTTTGGVIVTYGWTDTLGQVGGLVPANETLGMEVMSRCYSVVYTQNIQPLTQNTDLGTIVINTPSPLMQTINGSITSCNGTPVISNAYAVIYLNGQAYYAGVDSLGDYSVSVLTCNPVNTVGITVIDNNIGQQSSSVTVTTTGVNTTVPPISACGTSTAQYFNYTLDGTSYTISSTNNDSLSAYTSGLGTPNASTYLMGNRMTNGDNIYLVSGANAIGTFALRQISAQTFGNTAVVSPSNIVFNTFANNVGDFYEGTFNGSFSSGGATHTISGTFRVRRSF